LKIYTKTGDRGDTRLFDGTKVRKDNVRVEAYGDVDELNSFIGAAASFLKDEDLVSMLAEVQKDLLGRSWRTLASRIRAGRSFNSPKIAFWHSRMRSIVLRRNYSHCVNLFWQVEEMVGLYCTSLERFAGAPSVAS
jgi:ATP:cob(I)alamin adenosyltransferase